MENNESTETNKRPAGWSSDSIAPAAPKQGFYDTAGFDADEATDPSAEEPTDPSAEEPTDPSAEEPTDPSTGYAPPPPMADQSAPRRLYRTDGPISGVATGLAEYFNLDVALVRLIVVVASIVSFPVVPLAYVAAWIIIPRKDPAPTPPVMTAPVPMTDQVTPTAPTDTVTPPVDSLSGK